MYENRISSDRKAKDRLFRKIFGTKKWALELYNALNKTNYANEDDIKITTIETAIYLSMKNDVSVLIDGTMGLYEHQSTVNKNMPLRGLLYFGNLYNQYAEKNDLNIYGRRREAIPTPQYVVFYNGTEPLPDRTILKLSDAFINKEIKPAFEVECLVLNVNKGHNAKIMEKCKALCDYAEFIGMIRAEQKKGLSFSDAVIIAVNAADKMNLLDGFFRREKSEVITTVIEEYDEEKVLAGMYADGVDEGYDRGRLEGKTEDLKKIMKKFSMSEYQAMDVLEIPEEDRKAILAMLNKKS